MPEANRKGSHADAADAALLAGVREAVGARYEVDGILGAGAMGVVFRARETGSGREVAIKAMRPAIGYEDGVVERFRLEGQVMEQLHHDHIVKVHARGEAGHILWIAMDLVAGDPASRLIGTGPLAWRRTANFLAQAADALFYAHGRGVIHRDIKPANLLVTPADKIVITDFGIARIVGTKRLTATGMTVGTPSYMSPEQVFLDGEVAPATDQYSLGVVACRMLAGDPPPLGNPARWAPSWKHARWRASLRSLGGPPDLSFLIARMVHPAVGRRWPDLGIVSRAAREIAATGEAPWLRGVSADRSLASTLRRLVR